MAGCLQLKASELFTHTDPRVTPGCYATQPVLIGIMGSSPAFQLYNGGIFRNFAGCQECMVRACAMGWEALSPCLRWHAQVPTHAHACVPSFWPTGPADGRGGPVPT